ncbi:MAG: ParB/RepB/Spo0J family partition protein [Actinomycetia bacterium]|nr:ParB/RepB/Spo0J family partition protein [Actinomycetes bacterium]
MSQKRGLGKGLGALIPSGGVKIAAGTNTNVEQQPAVALEPNRVEPSAPSETPVVDLTTGGDAAAPNVPLGIQFIEIAVDAVEANPRQPRTVFDEEPLNELALSIQEIGLLQPIVVRAHGSGYELIAGERRLRATRSLGYATIPALVRETDDDAMLRDALLENLHRAQLNPLEEAAAYEQLMSDFACTQEELAARIGRSRPQISNTLRLLRLPPAVQRRVAAGVLSAGHARALLSFPDASAMEEMASKVVAEGLSVRALEELAIMANAAAGDEDQEPKRRRKAKVTPVEYREAADRLGDYLETRVRIDGTSRRGRLVVDFSDVTDLSRIIDLMGVAQES